MVDPYVLADLAASEEYNRACLDGTVSTFLARLARAALRRTRTAPTNWASATLMMSLTLESLYGVPRVARANVADIRRLTVPMSIRGRRVSWPLAGVPSLELATHADDIAAPIAHPKDRRAREWQRGSRPASLKETRSLDAQTDADHGHTCVHGEDLDIELPDAEFVQAAAARLDDSSRLDAQTRAAAG